MPKMYSEQMIKAFKEKLESLITHEEKGIEFEKSINSEANPIVRTVTVAVYKNVLQMLDEHLSQKPQKRTYNYTSGKRPGRPPKKATAEKEIAVSNEEE